MKRFESFLARLAQFQYERAGLVLLIAVAISAGSLVLVRKLTLDTSFVALLPQNKPSVRDLETLGDRVGGLRTLTVAVQSPSGDLEGMQRFIRAAAPRMAALDAYGIRSVDYTLGAYDDFVYEHRHLYAPLDDLEEIRDALQERVDYEKMRRNPFMVMLDDEEPESPEVILSRMQGRARESQARLERYPGGFYITPEHDLGAFFVRCDFTGGDNQGAGALISAVQAELDAINVSSFGPDLTAELAGNVIVSREEHAAILQEVSVAGGLTLVLSMIAILIFFRRPRVVPILGLSLIVPVLVTFAYAQVMVGALNTSTAFLGSIVFGNGVNPMIMWLARYFEERRAGHAVLEAMKRTHVGAWAGTLAAAATAATAYASLIATDFRGFHDFGIIGSAGQLLAWAAMLLLVPAATAMWERFRPLPVSTLAGETNVFGAFFWRVVSFRPGFIAFVSLVLGVASFATVAYAVAHDPLEYDFRKLRSDRTDSSRAGQINKRVSALMRGTTDQSFIAMALPDRALVADIQAQLEAGRTTEPPNYGRVRSINDLLPTQQAEKLPVVAEIRELLVEARAFATEEQQARIDEHMPPEDLRAIGDADLPDEIALRFTERDGTRGRLIAIERARGVSIWDGRYLTRWARDIREIRLPDGSRPPLAGEATVFADLVDSIVEDAPRTIALSFALTVLLVSFSFRRWRDRLVTLGGLLLGISVMGASMAVLGLKINFLNFIAIPIAFGLGVEYAVNVVRRYVQEEAEGNPEAVRAAVAETGGAVILCSITTILGYITLHSSRNQAIQSFGDAGGISEVACISAAVLTIPATLLWLERRAQKRKAAAHPAAAPPTEPDPS
ncbi:MAG: MMPL family transporter [Sandaracinaceae bacterium]|nr:MMPL family transporter [Sandaracinaceae bacterium]